VRPVDDPDVQLVVLVLLVDVGQCLVGQASR